MNYIELDTIFMHDKFKLPRKTILEYGLDAAKRNGEMWGYEVRAVVITKVEIEEKLIKYELSVYGTGKPADWDWSK